MTKDTTQSSLNATIPDVAYYQAICCNPELGTTASLVAIYLMTRIMQSGRCCSPRLAEIASDMGVSQATVSRAIRVLKSRKIIVTKNRNKESLGNLYWLTKSFIFDVEEAYLNGELQNFDGPQPHRRKQAGA